MVIVDSDAAQDTWLQSLNDLLPLQPNSGIFSRMGFLRQLFGPSQAEVWRRLAEETGSDFVDGGFWRGSKVVVRVKEWTSCISWCQV